jgi:hypothetical protein
MKFVNLTPHNVTVRPDGGTEIRIPASNSVARCQVISEKVAELNDIPVVRQVFGTPQGIPEPDEHGSVRYITSTLVAQAANRSDVVSPDTGPTAYRENGQVVAVRGFQLFAQQKQFFCWYDNGSGYYEGDPEGFPVLAVDAEEALRLMGGRSIHYGPGMRVITASEADDPNHGGEILAQ